MKPPKSVTYLLVAAAALLVALAAAAMPHHGRRPQPPLPPPPDPPAFVQPTPTPTPTPPPPPVAQNPEVPQVEVVFALDTTSSMSGLIDGAKRKIWSLVSFISSGQPRPHVRIGLVAYRDVGDAYVTRFYDLSDDLDQVFQHLSHLRAEGGGDTPEHVARALHDAVTRPSWSKGDKVARLIYVVGDAPPHFDYDDGYNVDALARRAAQQGIHVNTIRCGDDGEAGQAFRRIASLGKGQFATVEQGGGVATVTTPYDDRLAALNKKLVETTIAYGRDAELARAKMEGAASTPAAVAADRATVAARTGFSISGGGDLLDKVRSLGKGAGGVNAMSDAELPAEVAHLAPAAREKFVAEKLDERAKVMAEIKDLASKRDDFAAKKAKEAPRTAAGFDDSVRESLKAETRGLVKY